MRNDRCACGRFLSDTTCRLVLQNESMRASLQSDARFASISPAPFVPRMSVVASMESASSKPFRPVWFLFMVLCALVAVVAVSRLREPHELVPWRTDLAAGRREAEAANKPILIYLTADWCSPCQALKHTTWADKKVEQALRRYVPVKLDVDRQRDAALPYASDILPRYVILAPDGRALRAMDGYLDSEEFLKWLKG